MGQMGPMHSEWFDARCTVVPPPEWELQSVRDMETLGKFSFFPKTVVGKGLQVIHSPLVLVTIVIHHSLSQLSQASSRLFAVVCWVASARAVLQPTNLLAGLNNTRMSFWEGQSGQRTV